MAFIPGNFLYQKKNGKLRPVISFTTKSIYEETTIQNRDSQISMSVDIGPQLDYHVRRSGLSIHGLTLQNVPKSIDFYQTDGHYSITPASTCHPSISIPRRLAYKRSNSQPTNISYKILPPNCTKSRFHSKSKEVRFDTRPEIHVYRDGISDSTEYSQSTTRLIRFSASDYQTVSFSDASFGTNFPFSFGQTQYSSRFRSLRQTTLTSTLNVSFICLETSKKYPFILQNPIHSFSRMPVILDEELI